MSSAVVDLKGLPLNNTLQPTGGARCLSITQFTRQLLELLWLSEYRAISFDTDRICSAKFQFCEYENRSRENSTFLCHGHAALDGEIACIDGEGRPIFKDFTVPQLTPFVTTCTK